MAQKKIGADIGHCDTAAAYPQQNLNGKYEVKRLDTQRGNAQVIPTQIILTNEQMQSLKGVAKPGYELLKSIGPFEIGKLPSYVPNGERFVYFKVAPKDFDKPCGHTDVAKECGITHGMVMACYVYALVENIFAYNPGELKDYDRSNTALLIGCPTTKDWTAKTPRKIYADLIQIATGVGEVQIIPESRAAMFSSIDNGINNISAIGGAVVFDFGSSTADCTYMLMGRKIIEFSWTLGASAIERQMTLEALQTAVQQFGPFEPDMEKLIDSDAELRKVKEGYYDGMYPPMGQPYVCQMTNAQTGSPMMSVVMINKDFMQKVTGERKIQIQCDSQTIRGGSWQQLCREFFQEAKKRIEEAEYIHINQEGIEEKVPCTMNTVVLTGGASKMDFIETICREVFYEEEITIIPNRINPSHTVSNGLGWVAVSDDNMENCMARAKKAVVDTEACSIGVLRNAISNALFEKVKQVSIEQTQAWANKSGDTLTVEDLETMLNDAMNKPEMQTELKTLCNDNINHWKGYLSAAIEKAVNAQVKDLYSDTVAQALMIPNDIWKELQTGTLSLDSLDTDKLMQGVDFSNVIRQITRFIIKAVIWVIGVILAPETFGLSLIGAWIAAELTGDAISDKDKKKERPQIQRQRIANKVRAELGNKKNEVMKDFNNTFDQQTINYNDILDTTLKSAFEIVTLQKFEL